MPTNFTSVNGLYTAWDFLNDQSMFFGISIVIMTFFVSFFMMKQNFETKRAMAGSLFLTIIVAIWLRSIELVSTYVIVVCIVGLILSMFWLKSGTAEQFG